MAVIIKSASEAGVGEHEAEWPMCRLCLQPLIYFAEQKVGVHIWCVHKQESLRPVVRGASYGGGKR